MNEMEKIDFALLGLYKQTKVRGMLSIRQAFTENNQSLSIAELPMIRTFLEINYKFAVFQIEKKGEDLRGQILPEGIIFVETDSFSQPGTSILELENN
jgi:hypothetical protein